MIQPPDWRFLLSRVSLLPLVVVLLLALSALVLFQGRRRTAPSVARGEVETVWATDVNALPDGELRTGRKATGPIDPKHKRPPCAVRERIEVEVGGACWMPHAAKAPCPGPLYEHNGQCLAPVLAAARPPTSFGR